MSDIDLISTIEEKSHCEIHYIMVGRYEFQADLKSLNIHVENFEKLLGQI